MSPETPKVKVKVEGRELMLSNLDKVLYPEADFTKAEVIDYYQRIAPVMLPHIRNRPVTIKRYPEGVDHDFFYQKNAPAHRPDWVPTARLPSPGSTKNRQTIEYLLGGDLPDPDLGRQPRGARTAHADVAAARRRPAGSAGL